jgi:hypothetical protein
VTSLGLGSSRSCDDAGEVWVTRTVRDLVVGSGLTFAEHGIHQLKGGPWPLDAAS